MMDDQHARVEERRRIIGQAMARIRAIMDSGPSIDNLTAGKAILIGLAAREDLFTFSDFPLPEDDAMECSYLIHEYEDGGFSLYVNSGAPHQYYSPHDHGDAWAIIAGVRGRERHQLYLVDESGALIRMGEVVVAPGDAVTMQPDGIHEVNGMDAKPLLHLHLYAKNFMLQGERWQYDSETGIAERFTLDELGSISDAR